MPKNCLQLQAIQRVNKRPQSLLIAEGFVHDGGHAQDASIPSICAEDGDALPALFLLRSFTTIQNTSVCIARKMASTAGCLILRSLEIA